MDNISVRCPKCEWHPGPNHKWRCTCDHRWNTFDTGGRRPNCGKVWEHTQCTTAPTGCHLWSPHLDWYDGLEKIVNALKEEILEMWEIGVKV